MNTIKLVYHIPGTAPEERKARLLFKLNELAAALKSTENTNGGIISVNTLPRKRDIFGHPVGE